MTEQRDIELVLGSHIPIVVIETHEEPRAHALISAAAVRLYRPVFSWSVTDGLRRIDIDHLPLGQLVQPEAVLKHIKEGSSAGIFILNDFHPYVDDPTHVRLLKDIALASEKSSITIVLVSHELHLPRELQPFAATAQVALPDARRAEELVREVAGEWSRKSKVNARADEQAFQLLVKNLTGLTERDIRQMARKAIFDDGAITQSDLPQIMKAKYTLLSRQGVLTFEYDTARFGDVGGMGRMKTWLEARRAVFHQDDAQARRLDPPKGVLLLGVQGGGKSLAAKAVAGLFGVPLLRLDTGSLYNKFHGETERNVRESLATAEAMSPCVLWIDEIEKGLATGENDGGTSRRVLGTLLTWMAERKTRVFLVATANDIESLPPELVRKGRFDEIFFVDLPSPTVREAIFDIHLRRRDLDSGTYDLARLAAASDGFSGAEIEQAVVSALYAAHARDAVPDTDAILTELKATRPLSVTMRERMDYLRNWAAERTVPAD